MGPPIVMMHEGREVRLCCKGCIRKFEADAEKYFEKIDEAIVKDQLPHYPLTTCPVSQEALGSMGEPVNLVYNNRLVRFCCKGCVRQFKKAPADYLAELDAAVIANQTDGYPLSTCLISQEPLDAMGGPVDLVFANRLVRFCCNGCVGAFYKAPSVHLAALDKSRAEGHGHDDDHGHDHGHDDDHGHDHDHDHDH
jgi:YHS domain-containing protein